MTPRFASATALLFFCITALSDQTLRGADKPDILMIAIDDLRPMLGCYGDPNIKTPNIDRIADRGLVFERAYCQYAKCGTSRLSLMTGLRPDSVKVFSNNARDVKAFHKRRSDAVSIARWLKDKGYHTQSFGKIYHDGWDVAGDWSAPSSPGREKEMLEMHDDSGKSEKTIIADRWACPVLQSPDVSDETLFAGRMTTKVISTLQNGFDGKPTFIAVGYRRPHLPFIAPKKYFDLYQPDKSWLAKNPLPNSKSPIMAWFNSDGYVGGAKKVGLTMPNPPNREEAIAWNGYEMRSYLGVPNHGVIEQSLQLDLLQAYAACITYVDTQIGRLLDSLEKSKRLDKTIIILWSDHGWHLGEQSTWGKMTNFEIGTRVPFIISGPGIKPARTKNIAELVDLYPTLCDLAKVDAPSHLEGESLMPILLNPSNDFGTVALSQYARFGNKYMGYALRTDRYRFVVWQETKTGKVIERELYDHANDAAETRNLAATTDQAQRVIALEKQLFELLAESISSPH